MSQTSSPTWRPDLMALLNPPLLVSVSAESLAGAYVAGMPLNGLAPYLLAFASVLTFAAGGVFAASFDRAAALTRNPLLLPASDQTPPSLAWKLGWLFLIVGLGLPSLLGRSSALAAVGLALLVVLHSAMTREIWGAGFLTQGAARGANILMGLSANPEVMGFYWPIAIPIALLAVALAVMQHSRQPGAPPTTGFVALLHALAGLVVLLYLASAAFYYPLDALPFLFGALVLTLPKLVRLIQDPQRAAALDALRTGFLTLTVFAATLAAGYAGLRAGVLVAILAVPLSFALSRWPLLLITQPR